MRLVIMAYLCLVGGVLSCFPQTETTARIAGCVRDATGAVIANAEIVGRNSATGEKRKTTSDGAGDFALTSLSPGTYQVIISAPGFSAAQYSKIPAGISETITLNVVLRIAPSSSEATVSDTPPLVESSDAEIGISIDATMFSAAPLPTRNFLQLAAL